MQFDLLTLYFLAIGTLLLSAFMTMWERAVRPQRRRELGILALGYGTLAFGCALATVRTRFPGVTGSALSNLVLLGGYLLILAGAARLGGRRHPLLPVALLLAMAACWALAGPRWPQQVWSFATALPIALVSAVTAWDVGRSAALRPLRSRRVVAAVAGVHALFYAARAVLLPLLGAYFGPEFLITMAKATMYEGVLYSVGLPVALLALVREEAHETLLSASQTDHLTGIGNRRWFFEQGERLLARPGQGPSALLLFDLDHFKAINDRFGHSTGDLVLKRFADLAGQMMGPAAIFARVGGEEFAALLPGEGRTAAASTGQAIVRSFSQTVADDSQGIGVPATVSVGVAESGLDGADLSGIMSAADRALYTAKALGRNRVELATPSR